MIDRNVVLDALDEVLDPCSVAVGKPLGLTSMGLVESCTVEGGNVMLVLCTTGPGCLLIGNLLKAADTRVRAIDGVENVSLSVDTSVIWSSVRMRPRVSNALQAGAAGR